MRFKFWLGLIVVALAGVVYAQDGLPLVSLSTAAEVVGNGDEFTVTIQVQDATGVYGTSLKLVYDPQALEVLPQDNVILVPGDFFASQPGFPLKNNVDAATGTIEYALTLRQPAEAVSGSGVLGTLRLRALRDSLATIDLTEALLLSPQFEAVDGRQIARQVDEIAANVQGVTINVGAGDAAVAPSSVVATGPEAGVDLVPMSASGVSPLAVIVIMFFVVGLVLIVIGLGTYTQLRRRSRLQTGVRS